MMRDEREKELLEANSVLVEEVRVLRRRLADEITAHEMTRNGCIKMLREVRKMSSHIELYGSEDHNNVYNLDSRMQS
jgi:hypothetical protein